MTKRVLSVGHCAPDDTMLRAYLARHFDCQVVAVDDWDEALPHLRGGAVDLVLVNRKIDLDYSDGIDIICRIKADPQMAGVPVMMVSNYANHQDEAVAAGAVRGFGKLELDTEKTFQTLSAVLGGAEQRGD